MRPTISMSYGKGRSHGDSAKSLILYGNIGSDRKIPAVVLILQPGLLDNINEINGLAERTTPGCFCYPIDFTEQFRLGSRSPGCSTSTTAGPYRFGCAVSSDCGERAADGAFARVTKR